MPTIHLLHGLKVSSNRCLPGVRSVGAGRPDVEVEFGNLPQSAEKQPRTVLFPRNERERRQRPWLQVWILQDSGAFWLRYQDGTEFLVECNGRHVCCRWPEPFTLEDTAVYFLGPIFSLLLRLRGTFCLHSAGIAVDDQAVAIVGESGSGKSTLAAAFAKLGYAILCEDLLSLVSDGTGWAADPSHCTIRLWSDSVESLFGDPEACRPITANWDKRSLKLEENGFRFQDRSLPLSAIYVLDERTDDGQAPKIEELRPRDAVVRLLANSFGNYLSDRQMRETEFSQITRLVNEVPVRLVTPHSDIARLGELQDLLLRDHETVGLRSSVN